MTKWDVKVFDDDGEEQESIRGLTQAQQQALFRLFDREGIAARAKEYPRGSRKPVNRKEIGMGDL